MDVFCQIIDRQLPALIVYEDEGVIAFMDNSPYMPGHVLVVPKMHYATVLDMDAETNTHVNEVAKMLIREMMEHYEDIESVKLVANYGAEQKVKHYHLHVIPLYKERKKPNVSQEEYHKLLTE